MELPQIMNNGGLTFSSDKPSNSVARGIICNMETNTVIDFCLSGSTRFVMK